uniref:Uncharacterized protein n=1 Tax=Arundo donax TaxID=35708 RepID=A0A0A9B9F9_ARUDO
MLITILLKNINTMLMFHHSWTKLKHAICCHKIITTTMLDHI